MINILTQAGSNSDSNLTLFHIRNPREGRADARVAAQIYILSNLCSSRPRILATNVTMIALVCSSGWTLEYVSVSVGAQGALPPHQGHSFNGMACETEQYTVSCILSPNDISSVPLYSRPACCLTSAREYDYGAEPDMVVRIPMLHTKPCVSKRSFDVSKLNYHEQQRQTHGRQKCKPTIFEINLTQWFLHGDMAPFKVANSLSVHFSNRGMCFLNIEGLHLGVMLTGPVVVLLFSRQFQPSQSRYTGNDFRPYQISMAQVLMSTMPTQCWSPEASRQRCPRWHRDD